MSYGKIRENPRGRRKKFLLSTVYTVLLAVPIIAVAASPLMLVLALVYHLFPNAGQPFGFFAPGAVLVVMAGLAASLGFSYYAVVNFANRSATYGSLGAVIALLLYFFVSAAVLLLGAGMDAEVHHEVVEGEQGSKGAQPTETGPIGSFPAAVAMRPYSPDGSGLTTTPFRRRRRPQNCRTNSPSLLASSAHLEDISRMP